MTAARAWPVQITSLGRTAGATVVWRTRGQLSLTVIIKATFDLVPYGPMARRAPEGIHRGELHHRDNPTRSVRVTSDLAPYLGRADVLFTGHAHAPPGRSVGRQVVRLAVYREQALIDKTLHVYGDRADEIPAKPFKQMPIAYERAYGGVGWKANPLGIGFTGHSKGPTLLPNIVNPADPTLTDGFGPISRNWPARKKLLGKIDRKLLERPIAEIPDDFDWTYFQAAPADQQIDYLQGDEWIVLDGLHPNVPRIQSILPGARGVARLFGPEGEQPIEVHADTLRIDGDEQRCSLVWRGIAPVRDEAALAGLRVVVGLELSGESAQWRESTPMPGEDIPTEDLEEGDLIHSVTTLKRFDSTEDLRSVTHTAPLPPSPPAPFPLLDATQTLDPDAVPASEVPFVRRAPSPRRGAAPPIPGAPWSGVPAPASRPVDEKATRTFDLAFDSTPLPGGPSRFEDSVTDVVPQPRSSRKRPPPIPPPARVTGEPRPRFSSDESMTALVPFTPAPEGAPKAPAKAAPKPPPPPPSAPARAPEAAASPPPEKAAWPWASPPPTETPEEPPKPSPPPKPAKPPKPAVKKTLYGGFSPKK
jgi:hypothetical protein